MDLIYADQNKVDIGVIPFFDLDLAFGADENNFSLKINLEKHCCQVGYYIYIDGTEYGGIIDAITVDSKEKSVTYTGRTWHGMLAYKIIYPEGDYKVVSGDANEVLQDLIEELDYTDTFEVESASSNITVCDYQFERYVDAYTGILRMLNSCQAKLKMAWNHATNKIKLWAVLSVDHTDLDDWDSTQLDFNITQSDRYINHLVCLGQGELQDRAVIHLFTDENGVIQPYKRVEEPLQDSDYILDTSQQKMFGTDELVDVFDFANAGIAEKYKLLSSKPSDWISNYENFYVKEGDKYKNLEIDTMEYYEQLSTAPADWSTKYESYYYLDDDYKSVSAEYGYVALSSKPSNWEENYGNYFKLENNVYVPVTGVDVAGEIDELIHKPKDWEKKYSTYYEYNGVEYVTVGGISKDKYTLTNSQPNDWNHNYGNYYYKTTIWEEKTVKKKKTYVKKSDEWCPANEYYDQKTHEKKTYDRHHIPKWKRKKYYIKSSYQIAPKFRHTSQYTYYAIHEETRVAPTFVANTFYKQNNSQKTAPTFVSGRYYALKERNVYNEFVIGVYYRQVLDRYEELVEEGIKELQEIVEQSQSVNIDFDATEEYDIMDLVGATEQTTGIAVKQQILKKIVKMTEKKQEITYEIGAMI